jgi:catechol 2,3-dioxygenase-like lactoylglutathione lyase family enzyme
MATDADAFAPPTAERTDRFDVGGVLLERPFKIRRLGHFGVNVNELESAVSFYTRELGYRISDNNYAFRRLPAELQARFDGVEARGFFMRYGTDHHAFVLFSKAVTDLLARPKPGVTVNQITWQVGSLAEVIAAHAWFESQGMPVERAGRDMPGSNWHSYPVDTEGHTNELYYGIEQVGWDGRSKPTDMHDLKLRESPHLPQPSEEAEIEAARSRGIDLSSGMRYVDLGSTGEEHDVDGILLPRPFKIVRQGPVRLFVEDIATATDYYERILGLTVTQRVEYGRHTCVFLRCGTEHHSVALYPTALRGELGLTDHSTLLAFGVAVANYRQLRDAAGFLRARGHELVDLPGELFPGMDFCFQVRDPDGHLIQFHHYLQQVSPATGQQSVPGLVPLAGSTETWPRTIPPRSDTFGGEVFLGPWG